MATNTTPITSFRGEYAFLSNFYKTDFVWRNQTYSTVEHAFQSAKSLAMNTTIDVMREYTDKVRACELPKEAKAAGRRVEIDVKEWDARKVDFMREMVHSKFQTSEESLVGPLINTGAAMLVEGNTWGDETWGRCFHDGRWHGLNLLGAILMEERGYWLKGDFGA